MAGFAQNEGSCLGINERISQLAEPYLHTRRGLIHVPIVKDFADTLMQSELADPEIVIPAVLLHDVGWSALTEEMQLKAYGPTYDISLNRIHEVEGVKIARKLLHEAGYNNREKAEQIIEIIDGHDSRSTALSNSDMVVKDADKLYRFTQEGFSHLIGEFGVDAPFLSNHLGSEIDNWFFTPTAKKIASSELAKRKKDW